MSELLDEFRREMATVAGSLVRADPPFELELRVAKDYAALLSRSAGPVVGEHDLLDLAVRTGRLIVHGYAGSGKSLMLHRTFQRILDAGELAVLVRVRDLSRYRERWDALANASTTRASLLLRDIGRPRISEALIEEAGTRVFVLVDGLDEVPAEVGNAALDVLDDLATRLPNTFLVVTDRFSSRPIDTERWSLAALLPLREDVAQSLTKLNIGSEMSSQPLLTEPMFADLMLKSGGASQLSPPRTMAAAIEEMLLRDFDAGLIDRAAAGAFAAYSVEQSRIFSADLLDEFAGSEVLTHLVESGAVVVQGAYATFTANLVHDYLAARHLARHAALWNQVGFDAVSFSAASFDVLVLTAEILAQAWQTDEQLQDFVEAMYDWNFYAVGFVLARSEALEDESIPEATAIAIQASLAERRWDFILATGRRATETLRAINDHFSRELLELQDLDALREWVAAQTVATGWFTEWKSIFLTPTGAPVSQSFMREIASSDSIRGWTIANVARRTQPNKAAMHALRQALNQGPDAIRWRAAHVLGAFPDPANVEALLTAFLDDDYRWVRYGAVRSLLEGAAHTDDVGLRRSIFSTLAQYADAIVASRVLATEVERCLFVRSPPDDWADAIEPLIGALWNASSGVAQQKWSLISATVDRQKSNSSHVA